MLTIDINDINTVSNVRNEVGDITSLARSIEQIGLVQPILVAMAEEGEANDEKGYILVAGARRLAAVKSLGRNEIVAILSVGINTAPRLITAQFAENHERVDLTDWETAQVAMDLKLEGLKQAEVAEAMGVPTKDVSKMHKIVKALTKDEALDDLTASRFDFDGLLQLAETPIPEHSSDVMRKILDGDSRHVFGAVRKVEAELRTVEFYEENADQLNDWTEKGVEIVHTDPRHAWGKTTSYGPKDDPKVAMLDVLGITVSKHIKEGCHVVWLDDKGWEGPSFKHYCSNKKNHADKGASKVKAKDQEMVASNAPDPKARAERAAEKAAKDLRRAKAGKWMSKPIRKGEQYQLALFMALSNDGWKEEHVRAATWMLGLNSERPKGADYGWYQKRLDTWLDDKFGGNDPDADKRREWKIRMMHARRYIDDFWPVEAVKEQIEAVNVDE